MTENLTTFRMFLASCTGNAQNTLYDTVVEISGAEVLKVACQKDHVCTEFKDNRRGSDNFLRCHAIQADCDNDDTENPAEWISPVTVAERLPGIAFYAVKSRNCDKVKHAGEPGEKSARPRWHYYFPLRVAIPKIHIIREIMARLLVVFPEFDRDGMKPAQFFFGHAEPVVEYHPGKKDIAEFFVDHPEISAAIPAQKTADPADAPEPAAQCAADIESDTDYLSVHIEDMLAAIPADDYGTWHRVGMALKASNLPNAFDLWDRWSQGSSKYKGLEEIRKKWQSFKGSGITGGTLDFIAHNYGWTPNPAKYQEAQFRKYREAHKEEHRAALAAIGIETEDPYRYEWTLAFDGSIDTVTEKETGEIVYKKIRQANPAASAPVLLVPADPAAPWEPIRKGNPLPAFPLETFPEWIKDYIDNFSENTGISKDFCAACVLGAVSMVICGHINIHFNGTHYEPAQLYTVFVGRSGSMKSTAISQFTGPARIWLMEKNKGAKIANQVITEEISDLSEALSQEQKRKNNQDEERITEIKAQIERRKECKRILYPVPFTDVVPESVIKSMVETGGKCSIATAEGNLINVLTGRSYAQRGTAPNLDIFLAGHDGEPYHGIRVTSGEVEIPRVDISMLLAIQPNLLETLCRSPDANGRGLVQRFLIFAPEEPEISIDHTRPSTSNPQHASRWIEHIHTIADRFMRPNETPVIMELFNDADMKIRELWNDEAVMIREHSPADEEGITGWISKLHGKALRLAAILSILDEPQAQNITEENAEKAVKLLKEYFLPHYISAFESADNLTREERQIIGWITRRAQRDGIPDHFTERDLWMDLRQRSVFKGRTGKEIFTAALEGLQAKNIIRPLLTDRTRSGTSRPAKAWQINPEIFTK